MSLEIGEIIVTKEEKGWIAFTAIKSNNKIGKKFIGGYYKPTKEEALKSLKNYENTTSR